MNEMLKKTLNTVLPILLGVFVLYWIYRDFDFTRVSRQISIGIDWWWMAASLVFGILSHVLRGQRWKLALAPIDEHPRTANCIDAIFVSYAANLVVPRVGEVSRCGVLHRYDGTSFTGALGTVVTERIVDTLCIGIISAATFLLQMPQFMRFFSESGTKIPNVSHLVHSPWFYVCLFCVLGGIIVLCRLVRVLALAPRMKGAFQKLLRGVLSLRRVSSIPLYAAYTIGIWLCYFLHFYLTFYCFPYTMQLGVLAGLVMFVGGTFAVIVPTPNGAGPWHFAVMTMMMLYGVDSTDAATFALIVHAIQTLLVVVLGVWGWLALQGRNRRRI